MTDYILRRYEEADLPQARSLWNETILEANSFPGDCVLTEAEAAQMFAAQTAVGCAICENTLAGLYILHPNNIGRCAHIANASYTVAKAFRGQGLGRALVMDSIQKAKESGFMGLQFNAVVASNHSAIALYLKLGFSIIGTIRNGYRLNNGSYCDTLIFLKEWQTQ